MLLLSVIEHDKEPKAIKLDCLKQRKVILWLLGPIWDLKGIFQRETIAEIYFQRVGYFNGQLASWKTDRKTNSWTELKNHVQSATSWRKISFVSNTITNDLLNLIVNWPKEVQGSPMKPDQSPLIWLHLYKKSRLYEFF